MNKEEKIIKEKNGELPEEESMLNDDYINKILDIFYKIAKEEKGDFLKKYSEIYNFKSDLREKVELLDKKVEELNLVLNDFYENFSEDLKKRLLSLGKELLEILLENQLERESRIKAFFDSFRDAEMLAQMKKRKLEEGG